METVEVGRADVRTHNTELVPVEHISTGGHNPNGRVMGPAYDELREDVRKRGVLQAVLVRRDGGKAGRYFLIAGHRRLQAAIDTMLELIPVVVIESEPSSDDELRLIENIHRADLDPVSEADALSAMIRTFGADGPDEIATRVGKSPSHVRRRLSLLRVPKPVLEAVRKGEVTLGVAELVGSVDDKKLREKAGEEALSFTWERRPATLGEMREWLSRHAGHELKKAPWDVTDEKLYTGDPCKGACRHCPFNTQNQGDLFGDVGKEAACMNADGWKAKTKAFFEVRSRQVKAAGGTVLSGVEAKALDSGKSAGRFVRASDTCHNDSRYRTFGELAGKGLENRAVGLVNGEIVEAVDSKAVLAKQKEKGVKMKASTGHEPWKKAEAKKREKNRREKSTIVVVLEQLVPKAETTPLSPKWILEQLAAQVTSEQAKVLCVRRGWVPEKKKRSGGPGWSPRDVVRERAAELTDAQAQGAIVEILAVPSFPGQTKAIEAACAHYGVSWERILKSAEQGEKPATAKKSASPEKKATVGDVAAYRRGGPDAVKRQKPPRGQRPRTRGAKKAAKKKGSRKK